MDSSRYLVAGLGKTGHSIARYLHNRAKSFVFFDTRKDPEGLANFQEEFPGVEVFLGEIPDNLLNQLKEIISSPGVPLDSPFFLKAKSLNIPIVGDIEYLAREINNVPVIAITGTNGKSTVTTLVGEMAKASGLSVAVAGNIGAPVLDLLDNHINYDLWVLELSSFQLDLTFSLAPFAATILNVTPDHLDRHHSFDAYINAKQQIYHQASKLIYNRGDKNTIPLLKEKDNSNNLEDIDNLSFESRSPATCSRDPELFLNTQEYCRDSDRNGSREQVAGRRIMNCQQTLISFGLDEPSAGNWGIITKDGTYYLAYGNEILLPVEDIKIKGRHNWQNALAACALADAYGISRQFMLAVLKSFAGLPHRSQWVRTIDGVDWINDSKGTNIGATMSAIAGIGDSMQGKIILIAGGQGKGADFTELRTSVADYIRTVVLIGEDADLIEKAISDLVNVIRASSLDEAVTKAKTLATPGDVVLLSPACASLDMFRDFNHRGDSFATAVNSL